ncbi:MAG: hypothetical protein NC489_38855 [Ruminococcus flavefaciens]|nr:hypothetical protein [Ruminococcus flavefaciens]
MPSMSKRVNIRTTVAVRTTNPPICGTKKNTIMSTSDILKCLCRRAVVEEILPNGSTIRLNMSNYNRDNGAGLDAYHPVKVEEPVQAPAVNNPEPVKAPEIKEEEVNANVTSMADLFQPEPTEEPVVEEPTPVEESAIDETPEDEVADDTATETAPTQQNSGHHKKKNRH